MFLPFSCFIHPQTMFLYNLTVHFQCAHLPHWNLVLLLLLLFFACLFHFLLLNVANCFSLSLTTTPQIEMFQLFVMYRKNNLV